MLKCLPEGRLRIIADNQRIERYKNEGIYCNGDRCDFYYVTPESDCDPADLLIFAVFSDLFEAISAAKKHVGPNTIIISLLNGISSESIISSIYGEEKLIYCVAQGMDAVKVGNHLTYHTPGVLCIGEKEPGIISQRIYDIAGFFDKTGISYEIKTDMQKHMWGKFMLNVGVNQTAAIYGCSYGGLQQEGAFRDIMILAMQEVLMLSSKEGTGLNQKDLDYWLTVIEPLHPDGKPSMQQDIEAKRRSEVDLFAGTVLSIAEKHGIFTPVNRMLYDKILNIEKGFSY
ncbi:MAG TPA: 2-dehydropantoate 2-reductase [Clostridiales bacterium]|nr:2-dehydropantoate 2-reductase [Clostridiales bacterium]